MRMILVDHALADAQRPELGPAAPRSGSNVEIPQRGARGRDLALDDALDEAREVDGEQAQIVELRFFAGLAVEEIAEIVGRLDGTVKRDWQAARALLSRSSASA